MPIKPASCALVLEAALAFGLYTMPLRAAHAADAPRDACSMLTASEVSAVLGISVADGQHPIASSVLLCGWTPTGGPQTDGKRLSVSLMTERAFEVGKSPVHGAAKTTVAGLGDDAYFIAAGGLGAGLSIKKGDAYVRIRVDGFSASKEMQLEKALAMQMLAKL